MTTYRNKRTYGWREIKTALMTIGGIIVVGLTIGGILYKAYGGFDDKKPNSAASHNASASQSPTTSPTQTTVVHSVGQVVTVSNSYFTVMVTVLDYKSGVQDYYLTSDEYQSGTRRDAIKVRTCYKSAKPGRTGFTVSSRPWYLTFADGGTYQLIDVYDNDPKPSYPENYPLVVGACATGWITFTVDKASTGAGITYAVDGAEPVYWKL